MRNSWVLDLSLSGIAHIPTNVLSVIIFLPCSFFSLDRNNMHLFWVVSGLSLEQSTRRGLTQRNSKISGLRYPLWSLPSYLHKRGRSGHFFPFLDFSYSKFNRQTTGSTRRLYSRDPVDGKLDLVEVLMVQIHLSMITFGKKKNISLISRRRPLPSPSPFDHER